MPGRAAIQLDGVSKCYRVYHQRHQTLKEAVLKLGRGRWEELWALRNVTLEIPLGQTVGVIGENGSGKSTLLKLLAGILQPDEGRVAVEGRISSLLELGTSFQMEYTGRANIFLYGTMLGLRRKEILQRYDDILAFSELGEAIDNPVKSYSTGMYMRLAFAIAVQVNPDVLLVDEVLAVGDEAFQRKCFARMEQFRGGDRTIFLVSHDLDAVRRFCDRVLWIDRGRLAADGEAPSVVERYLDTTSQRIASGDFGLARPVVHEVAGIGQVTGKVQVAAVGVLDRSGAERNLFREGEPITITVTCRSHISTEDAAMSVSIYRSDGLHCVEFSTADDGLVWELSPGVVVASVQIPAFPFTDGTYEVSVGVFDSVTKTTHDFQHRRNRFRVQGAGSATGLARVEHDWQLERRRAGTARENPAIGA